MIDVWTDPELSELDPSLLAIADALVSSTPRQRRARPSVPVLVAAALVVVVAALVPAVALSKGLRSLVGLGTPQEPRVYASIVQWPPLAARPGARVRVTWRLWTQPVIHLTGRGPVILTVGQDLVEQRTFARILNPARTASASGPGRYANGAYTATVTVPPGGVGHLQFGMRVWRQEASGNRLVPVLFPLRAETMPAIAIVHKK